MCGIFGATEKDRFLTLYKLNKKRGTFATSLCLVTDKGDLIIHRWSGSVDVKLVETAFQRDKAKIVLYLGHTQAPTSSKRKYDVKTAHPFNYENFTVAHNGVLTNFKEIKEQFDPKWSNPVDTSIIPVMLSESYKAGEGSLTPVDTTSRVLGLLEGTFGVWIYDSNYNNTYIARCGSTVFVNYLYNEFSSVKFSQCELLPEGVLFQLTPEGITAVSQFDFDSPFFT